MISSQTSPAISRPVVLLVARIALLAIGCVGCTAPAAENMTPQINPVAKVGAGTRSVEVALPVGEFDQPGLIHKHHGIEVSPEVYQNAVVETLKQSGLFASVVTSRPADYEFITRLSSSRLSSPSAFAFKWSLLVNYRLIETSTKRETWQDDVYSEYELETQFATPNDTTIGQEGVIRNNLSQVVPKLTALKLQ